MRVPDDSADAGGSASLGLVVEAALVAAREKLITLDVAAGIAEQLRLEVEQLAASGPLTTAVLAGKLGVTDRTVRRDFELLRQAGVIEPAEAPATYRLRA